MLEERPEEQIVPGGSPDRVRNRGRMGNGGGASAELPEWLPDGWIMKTKSRKDGKIDRYYVSPMPKRTFRSRVEVLRYLNSECADPTVAVRTTCEKVKRSCFIDPLTRCRFYSKAEVFRHLKAEESCKFTSKMKKLSRVKHEEEPHCICADSKDDLNALPLMGKIRMDPARAIAFPFIHPHQKDFGSPGHYLLTLPLLQPPISAKKWNEGSRARRCLFLGKVQNSGRRTGEEGDELMIARITTPPSAEATPHSEKVAGLSCRYPTGLLPLGNKKGKVIDHFHGEGLPDLGLEPAEKAAALNHVLKKKQDPTEPSLENHIESENVETQKAMDSQGAVPAGQEPSRILRRSIRLHASKGAAFEISGRGACGSKRSGEDDPDGKLDRHSRSEKLALLTSRASKRLAGLEPDPTVGIEVGDRSLKRGRPSTRSRSRLVPSPFSDIRDLAADPPKFEDGSLGGRVGSADHAGAGDTAAEFAVTSPFGDRWPDPCIEFAFKTLTGQIPVPEAAAIGDYFCEWLSPPPAAADGAPTPPEVPEKSLFPPA